MYKRMVAEMTTGSSAVAHDLAIKAHPSNHSYGIMVEHLTPLRRCIDLITPDGNCMFRASSKEILGTDRHHYKVRTLAVEFMAANSKLYSPIIANYHSCSLKEHIQQMNLGYCCRTSSYSFTLPSTNKGPDL